MAHCVAQVISSFGRRSRAKLLKFKGTLLHPPPPTASLMPRSVVYKAQIDQVLDEQAKLTDTQKTRARLLCLHSYIVWLHMLPCM